MTIPKSSSPGNTSARAERYRSRKPGVVDRAREADVRGRAGAHPLQEVTFADDDELVGEVGERFDDEVGALVAHEPAHVQEVPLAGFRPG